MKIQNQGFDHVEFCVNSIAAHEPTYLKMGFEKVGVSSLSSRGTRSALFQQGYIRILVTEYDPSAASQSELGYQFLKAHGEGICVLALDVDDARAAYAETVARGARSAMAPQRFETPQGSVTVAEIWTPADVRYRFIERKGNLFLEGLVASRMESPSPLHLRVIDHLTNNIDMGETAKWVKYYTEVFGFEVVRHFDIRTGRTGLTSEVVQSKCGKIKVPINEATEKESQVQEFVDRLKGPGVQHLAFLTTDIMPTVSSLQKQGFRFLTVPHTYYEVVPKRVPGVTEDLVELEKLGILLDGEGGGYLLQIFTAELAGPFFLEFIQRKKNQGFGEGNFRALFEAIERDQVARGVLKA